MFHIFLTWKISHLIRIWNRRWNLRNKYHDGDTFYSTFFFKLTGYVTEISPKYCLFLIFFYSATDLRLLVSCEHLVSFSLMLLINHKGIGLQISKRKTLKYCCGNSVRTMRKMCISTNFHSRKLGKILVFT